MHFIIINGPNLNLLGKREPSVYGNQSFEDYFSTLSQKYPAISLSCFQSNHEGEIIDKLHAIGFDYQGIILNAGAFTHTSIAIRDAIAAITAPVIEVHISNVHARESFRHHSTISPVAKGVIIGLGLSGYALALDYLIASNTA
ncbi:MAG: type II 3-dehydroquinate dehydratase [Bacteroidetes bacterium]|jgi:3-dehydroquinate dehydratase-2|nr:type II 3-dehydroquinate dehydratase [Bacteroidota bacterium]